MDEEEVKFVYTIHITCLLELQTKVREDFIITGMAPILLLGLLAPD